MKAAIAKRVILLDGVDNHYLVLDPDFPGCIGQADKEPVGMAEGLDKELYKHRAVGSHSYAVVFCRAYHESMYPGVFWGRTLAATLSMMKVENPDEEQIAKTPILSGEQCAQILEKMGFARIVTPDAVPGHIRFYFNEHIFVEDKPTSTIVSIPKAPQVDRLALIYILTTLSATWDDFTGGPVGISER